MDMLCLMFHCDERGVLVTAGKPWTVEEVAGAIRGPIDVNRADVDELLAKGVAHKDSRGAIYSKRMVRDEEIRRQTKSRVKNHRKCNASVTPKKRTGTEEEKEEEGFPSWIPKKPWDDFVEMRIRIRKPLTPRAIELAVQKLDELRKDGNKPGDVLNQSVMNSYQGLFEVKADKKKPQSYSENIVLAEPMQYCWNCNGKSKLGEGKGTDGMYCSEKCEEIYEARKAAKL